MDSEPLTELELGYLIDMAFAEIGCFDVIGHGDTNISDLVKLRMLLLLLVLRWKRPIAWRLVSGVMLKHGIAITVSEYQRERRRLRPKLRAYKHSYHLHGEGILPILARI
jgi:hypothetical protein